MPAVYTDRVNGSQKLSWLLPNIDFANRLEEYLLDEDVVPEVTPLKRQVRVTAEYPRDKANRVQFACYLFERRCIRHMTMETELMGSSTKLYALT